MNVGAEGYYLVLLQPHIHLSHAILLASNITIVNRRSAVFNPRAGISMRYTLMLLSGARSLLAGICIASSPWIQWYMCGDDCRED